VEAIEVDKMAAVEASHWWYLALRDALGRTLMHPELRLPSHPKVLDAGCGTGEHLRFLDQLLGPSYLGGFDVSARAVALATAKAPGADVYQSDLCDPELHVDSLDLIVSCDVICIPGIARTLRGLEKLVRNLKSGGILVLNLPAYSWLKSEHDVAVNTSERYTSGDVSRLMDQLGLEKLRLSYRLCLLLPLVAAVRLPGILKRVEPDRARSDLHLAPSAPVNRLLFRLLALENRLIARGISLPFGSSVLAIARKR